MVFSQSSHLCLFKYLPCSLIAQLRGHTAELSNCVWNFSCDRIATASLDSTAQLWDVRRLDVPFHNITGHREEVLDVCFNSTGCQLATCSSDCTARVWDIRGDLLQLSVMEGHKDEVSKVPHYFLFFFCSCFCFFTRKLFACRFASVHQVLYS